MYFVSSNQTCPLQGFGHSSIGNDPSFYIWFLVAALSCSPVHANLSFAQCPLATDAVISGLINHVDPIHWEGTIKNLAGWCTIHPINFIVPTDFPGWMSFIHRQNWFKPSRSSVLTHICSCNFGFERVTACLDQTDSWSWVLGCDCLASAWSPWYMPIYLLLSVAYLHWRSKLFKASLK